MGCVDARTSEVLQEIIQETTNRINRMQQQTSQNEIAEAKLAGLIDIERKRTELIEAQTDNEKKRATMEGEAHGRRPNAESRQRQCDALRHATRHATQVA